MPMIGFDPAHSFGPDVARRYDQFPRGDEAAAVDFLAALARGDSALEFAIGTGRIAIPLAQRGVRVEGIELSAAMVEQLRTKPGGTDMDVHVGDMTTTQTGRTYPLVYLVFNTIFNLLTQDDQIRCFENAARHLADDGVFLVEAAVPSAWLPATSTSTQNESSQRLWCLTSADTTRSPRSLTRTTSASMPPVFTWVRSRAASPGRPNSTSWHDLLD